jgi:hypothetical protein
MGCSSRYSNRIATRFPELNAVAADGLSRKDVNLGVGCLIAFLLPFAAAGIVTAVLAMQRLFARNWTEALFFALFAVTFGGVGFGGIAAALAGRRKLKEQALLRARHPDAPWLWRTDWASGRILDSSRALMFTAWIVAGFWFLIAVPTGFLGLRAAIQEGKPAALLALLFPMFGIGLIGWAVRQTLRYRKYGVSRLELSTVPGVIGRRLSGMVRAPARLHSKEGFQVKLICVRKVRTRRGRNTARVESILWEEAQTVQGVLTRASASMEIHIPVAFRLPPEVEPYDVTDSTNRVLWRLQVTASVPGVDYESQFEVPVFRTPESDQPRSLEEARLTEEPAESAYRQPADSPIVVSSSRRGTEVLLPAARNPGAAAGLTIVLLLWLGAIVLLAYYRSPVLFPIITGLFGVLILVVVLDLWLKVSRIIVDAGTLTWASGYIVPARERTIPTSEVADVTTSIGMQVGGTVYYDIVVVRKNGKTMKVGHSIRDKREAEWLAGRIKRAISF